MTWHAALRLMRLNKPIGILLLWFPVGMALWLSHHGRPPLALTLYFLLGTLVMRAAGCIVNDIADRHIDKHVRRTAKRPLTTGEMSVREALWLFIGLLCIALWTVLQLPILCLYEALLGLALTSIYPFCKRWIQAPQLVLSLAFSISIPMVYTASSTPFDTNMLLLLFFNSLWVLAYDTVYAMVDRDDDLKCGVKSTAVLFGQLDCWIIGLIQAVMHGLWLWILPHDALFFIGWGLGAIVLIYQQTLIAHRNPADCFRAFHWSVGYGLIMWCCVIQ